MYIEDFEKHIASFEGAMLAGLATSDRELFAPHRLLQENTAPLAVGNSSSSQVLGLEESRRVSMILQ